MSTLAPLSNLRDSDRGRAMLAIILTASPFLRFLEANSAFEEDATNFDWLPVSGTSSAQARDIGGSYTATQETPGSRLAGLLAMHGDAQMIDESHLADAARGLRDVPVWFQKQLVRKGTSFGEAFEGLLFNGTGTGTPLQIKGLLNILDGTTDLPGFSGKKGVIDARTYGGSGVSFDLSGSTNDAAFLEGLELSLGEVDNPTGIVANRKLAARITTIAHRSRKIDITQDQFGQRITTYDGVPIIQVKDGTIKNDEKDNTPTTPLTNTTSYYIMSPGEQRVSLVTNSGVDYHEHDHPDNKEVNKERWEIRSAWKIEQEVAIRRVRNIKIA